MTLKGEEAVRSNVPDHRPRLNPYPERHARQLRHLLQR
jgi:hypothetical protein